MAKKSIGESDETRLKKKIAATMKEEKKLSGDPATRSLRKRLKRVQRKRRALSSRKKHAAGRKQKRKPSGLLIQDLMPAPFPCVTKEDSYGTSW